MTTNALGLGCPTSLYGREGDVSELPSFATPVALQTLSTASHTVPSAASNACKLSGQTN